MKNLFFILTALFLFGKPEAAPPENGYGLKIRETHIRQQAGQLNIHLLLDYGQLRIPSNDELILQPAIIRNTDTLRLAYLVFPGKIRHKVNQRKTELYGPGPLLSSAYQILYPESGDSLINYTQSVPFANWMYGARLELLQETYGCADCHKTLAALPLFQMQKQPKVAFFSPQPQTRHSEKTVLHVQFPWDQAVILSHFGNNEEELNRIGQLLQKISRERPADLEGMQLTGYASPEGAYAYNARLAGSRVQAVKNYIRDHYQLDDRLFHVDTIPEDWPEVRRKVDSSDLPYRTQIMDIIDRTPNPDARDSQLRRLDRNQTYNYLLHHVYPPLRRVEYTVHYRIQPLNASEAAQLLEQHPEQLTAYELYEVAQTYPPASPEFKALILTSVKRFPKDPATNNNAAALALNNNQTAEAEAYLQTVRNEPIAQNNLGVLLLQKGDIQQALDCFKRAGQDGCKEAAYNLQYAIPHPIQK